MRMMYLLFEQKRLDKKKKLEVLTFNKCLKYLMRNFYETFGQNKLKRNLVNETFEFKDYC